MWRPYSNSPCVWLVSVQGKGREEQVSVRKGRGTQIPACGAGFYCISLLPLPPMSQSLPFNHVTLPSPLLLPIPTDWRGRDHTEVHRKRAPYRKSRVSLSTHVLGPEHAGRLGENPLKAKFLRSLSQKPMDKFNQLLIIVFKLSLTHAISSINDADLIFDWHTGDRKCTSIRS